MKVLHHKKYAIKIPASFLVKKNKKYFLDFIVLVGLNLNFLDPKDFQIQTSYKIAKI